MKYIPEEKRNLNFKMRSLRNAIESIRGPKEEKKIEMKRKLLEPDNVNE